MNLLNLMETTDTDEHWMDQARCLGIDPNVMQPEAATEQEVADAKAVCAGCPVFADCKAHAAAQNPAYGVHAGEWWGPEPSWEVERTCELDGCDVEFRTTRDGRGSMRFCSKACRLESYKKAPAPAQELEPAPVVDRARPAFSTCESCATDVPRRKGKQARRFCDPCLSARRAKLATVQA